jgi:hypothetical protein
LIPTVSKAVYILAALEKEMTVCPTFLLNIYCAQEIIDKKY